MNPIEKIRVLIVDDSPVMRRVIMNALLHHEDIEVVGTASNGVLALEALSRSDPDIVTLDVEMPEMDGLTALKEIKKIRPLIPVIMFSKLTQRGAKITIDALTSGASDYVGKPENVQDLEATYAILESDLIPKIKNLCSSKNKNRGQAPSLRERGIARREQQAQTLGHAEIKPESKPAVHEAPVKMPEPVFIEAIKIPEHTPSRRIDAIVIGVSTGGPAALMTLFTGLKIPLKVPVFIVQHMPPKFTELLAARLTDLCATPVSEPSEGQEAIPGQAFIAPGGFHLYLKRKGTKVSMHLNEGPPENSCRPSVDVLFRSAAQVYGKNLLSVVLTGMGSDGLKGAQEILLNGGSVIAQDQETSVVWGMPGAIAEANLAEKILPLDKIADELTFLTQLK